MGSKAAKALEWPVWRPRGWGRPSGGRALPRPWWGLDTERDSKDGRFVCGWCVGDGGVKGFDRMFDLDRGVYWIHNLAYDVEGMLRDLGIDEMWAAKVDGARFELEGGECVYYHGKRFEWRREDGDKLLFLDSSAFFGRMPLRKLGAKGGMDASRMSLDRYWADNLYRLKVDEYCIQDARIVYEAMVRLNENVGGHGVDLASTPGGTARRYLGRLPALPDVIWRTHKSFLKSYCGGRFEVVKRGVFWNGFQYDISSAYPWALSKCPWLTKGAYSKVGRRLSDDSLYGSYLVEFRCDDYLGLAPMWKDGVRVYSNGEKGCWIARPEVEWLQEKGVGYRILRGVEIFDGGALDLWKEVIVGLFEQKKEAGVGFGKWGPKILLNTQYGILIQLVQKSGRWVKIGDAKEPVDFAGLLALEAAPKEFEGGKYFAPVYAGNLTALVRLKILEAAENVGYENYIGGHTDSIISLKRLDGRFLGDGLGDWGLEREARRLDVCKTGMYALDDYVKMRGITRKGDSGMLWEPELVKNSRRGIKSANGWGEVSVIGPKKVVNNFEVEKKRLWLGGLDRRLIEREEWIDSEALCNVGT